ncbi:MAG: HYR domain-containing protein [Candidatus Sumerlaeia bacterium]|nr:HYR domain-containing protein [Candidatus Sumerlaeia bacterium]
MPSNPGRNAPGECRVTETSARRLLRNLTQGVAAILAAAAVLAPATVGAQCAAQPVFSSPVKVTFGGGNTTVSNRAIADQFTLAQSRELTCVRFWVESPNAGQLDGVYLVAIFPDVGGAPDTANPLLGPANLVSVSETATGRTRAGGLVSEFVIDGQFATPITLGPGTYWFGLKARSACSATVTNFVNWVESDTAGGHYRSPATNCGLPTQAQATQGNMAFEIFRTAPSCLDAPTVADCSSNIAVDNDPGDCGAIVTWTEPTATSNCGGTITTVQSHNSGDFFPIGTTTVTYTFFDDESANSATCTFDVTVTDAEAPQVTCQNVTVNLGLFGNGILLPAQLEASRSDNCGFDLFGSRSASQTTFNCGDVGDVPVVLTVTDENGNTATCEATVTVVDNIGPIAFAPLPVTIECGESTDPSNTGEPFIEFDACGIASNTFDDSFSGDSCVGQIERTWTIIDNGGNSTQVSQTITIEDTTAPTADVPATFDAFLDATGTAMVSVNDLVANLVDSCGNQPSAVLGGTISYNCADLNQTYTVEVIVTDDCLNSNSYFVDVTVNDAIAPTFTECPPYSFLPPGGVLTANAEGGFDPISAGWADDASVFGTDNCPDYLTVSFLPTFFNLGCTTVTATLEDGDGNTATCSFDVMIGSDDGGRADFDSSFSQDSFITAGATPGVGASLFISGRRGTVGDTPLNRETRAIFGYVTDLGCAGITDANLRLVVERKTGNVEALGDLVVELASPFFGASQSWSASDFEAAADFTPVGVIPAATLAAAQPGEAIMVPLDPASWIFIPVSGNVQFRLRPTLPTDGDNGEDSIQFGAGGHTAQNRFLRSDLMLNYILPTDVGCGLNGTGSGAPLELDPLYSNPNFDGSVTESARGSFVGNLRDNSNAVMDLGDTAVGQQTKLLVSFDTSQIGSIYPGGNIVSARLCMTRAGVVGDPSALGRLYVEALCQNQAVNFGDSYALELEDFASYAWITDATAVEPEFPAADGDQVCWELSPEAIAAIYRSGQAQFRIRFETPTNGDAERDLLRFFSGNAGGDARPTLEIEIAP